MKSIFRQIFALVPAILLPIIVPAQEVPVLAEDPAITRGILPNGMSYYIVSDKSVERTADFALVQKTGRKTVADSADCSGSRAVISAREALAELPHFGSRIPQDFIMEHGAASGRSGFVSVSDDATVYRFNSVRLGDGRHVMDSALLMLLDVTDKMSSECLNPAARWYAPADQAVIISGDVNAAAVEEKLMVMSLMTAAREPLPRTAYEWHQHDTVSFSTSDKDGSGLVEISATWVSPRIPREYMHTVQPLVYDRSVEALGIVSRNRIMKLCRERDIPYAEVDYRHVSSSRTSGDDSFRVSLVVSDENSEPALEILAEVMASLDCHGAAVGEFLVAEAEYISALKSVKSDNVDRCISSFLYNSSLASDKEILSYHQTRTLPDTVRCRLFNGIASALLDGSQNLTVACPADSSTAVHVFDSVWSAVSDSPYSSRIYHDVELLPDTDVIPKVKLKSVKKEHVSGGEIWTFSNGFKVIYKKMNTGGVMYYTLALNGGYGSIKGLSKGEGAFMSDYPMLCCFSGMEAGRFMDILSVEGISLDTRVTLSNTLISGELPRNRMQLLMRALLSFANARTADEDSYAYYRKNEQLALKHARGSFVARMTAIDSTMCPDYRYSPYKSEAGLTASFPEKAEGFFATQSEKMNDGALVLVGDMEADELKKLLASYVGGFRTMESSARRPVVKYQPVSGWSTYTVKGDVNSIDVVMSARMPVTAGNYMAAAIASMILQRSLLEALDDAGMYVDLSYNCRIYPEERLNMLISVSQVPEDGFAAGMNVKDPISALSEVRAALSDLAHMDISDAEMNDCKRALKYAVSREMNDPLYWVNAITIRYLDGKDLSSGYAAKIDAVTPDKVREILSSLAAGSKVEYVTKR